MGFPRVFQALFLAAVVSAIPAVSNAEISISVNIGPPALPVYEQPMCPGPDYIWTPGYWAWGPDGYYWVPGTWVVAPSPGLLWTPGYWGWVSNVYVWHPGYWGPHVGFYGGVNYGYGYTGEGYWGGRWEGNHFAYNRVVNNVNITNVHNVYVDKTVIVNNNVNRVSFNGGPGGIHAAPTQVDMRAAQERHLAPVSMQMQHEQMARADRNQWANVNHGRPALVAAPRPLASPTHQNFAPANNAPGRSFNPAENNVRPENNPRPSINNPSANGPAMNARSNIAPARGVENRGVENRPAFDNRDNRQIQQAPQSRPQQMPEHQAAPMQPQYRVQQMPQQRPAMEPQYRPQPVPQNRPQQMQMPQSRPQAMPQYHPQQEIHQPAPAPHMERPAPSNGGRPEGDQHPHR